eukprot:GHVT01048680.1.p1 GENE.GHVT01048680.1~~GHVT01048680.1.p1  ORF type:complete len:176 (-),score=30.99 GHVT01048680.1:1193-1720(-)
MISIGVVGFQRVGIFSLHVRVSLLTGVPLGCVILHGQEPAQGFPPGDSRHPTSFLSSVANASTAGLPDNDSSTGADTLPFSRRPLLLPSRRRLSSPGVCVEVAATAAAREKPAQKTAAVGDDKAVEDEAADTWRNPKNANAPNAQKAEQNDDPNFWTNLTVEKLGSHTQLLPYYA